MGAKVGHLAWARGLLRPVPRALHPDRPPDRGLRQGVGGRSIRPMRSRPPVEGAGWAARPPVRNPDGSGRGLPFSPATAGDELHHP
jgi:hypothetical protein